MATEHVGRIIRVPDLRNGYIEVLREIEKFGRESQPRGRATLELLAPTIVLEDPIDSLPLGVGRKLNLSIAAVEACQLVAGHPAPELVLATSGNFKQFTEPDGTFHGNYGSRISGQFYEALSKLRLDPDTRQAMITLWRPDLDNVTNKRDYPCTVALQLVLREGRVHLISTMRSNDAWLGLAYDAFQFSQLLLTAARVLDAEPGQLIHQPGSLHLYVDDVESGRVDQLRETSDPRPALLPVGFGCRASAPGEPIVRAYFVLKGTPIAEETTSESWYREHLDPLR